MRLGLVGLGRVGGNMARQISSTGYETRLFDAMFGDQTLFHQMDYRCRCRSMARRDARVINIVDTTVTMRPTTSSA